MNLKICVLGSGKMSQKHLKILKSFPNVQLSVASRSSEKAQALKNKFKLHQAYASYEEAFAAHEDIILITTPPNTHYALCKKALEANKHVIVEKPAFNSLTEFQEMFELAQKKQKKLWVAENQSYDPFHQKLLKFIKTHPAGFPYFLELVRIGKNNLQGWRNNPQEMKLGALHEGGVHWIRRLRELGDCFESEKNIQNVKNSFAFAPKSNSPFEDSAILVFQQKSGLTSQLIHSWRVPNRFLGLFNFSRLFCENYSIYFSGKCLGGIAIAKGKIRFLLPCFNDLGGFKAMWKDFIGALSTNTDPQLKMNDVLEDFVLLEKAYAQIFPLSPTPSPVGRGEG